MFGKTFSKGVIRLKKAMNPKPILIDVRGAFDKEKAESKGICYRTI
jgi:hypothetical protein